MKAPDSFDQDDRRIDAVLHALGEAQPHEALQGRLLAALHRADATDRRQHASAGARWLTSLLPSGLTLPRVALVACLLTTAGLCVYRAAVHDGRSAPTRIAKLGGFPSVARVPHRPSAVAAARQDLASGVEAMHASPDLPLGRRTHVLTASVARGATTAPQSSQQLQAVSIASSTLPLTEQERLLLQLSHHQPAEQLAQLTQPTRDAAFQQEKAAVTEFFLPAPPLRAQAEPSAEDQSDGQP